MNKFIIQVNGTVYGSTASFRALRFTTSVLSLGHQVTRIFFYQDGVTNSSQLICPASDEYDLHQAWKNLATEHNIQLINCVSAALRRGVLSQQDAIENTKSQFNSSAPFEMGGLGELVTGIETSDRLVCF
ncbi:MULTISPECIES: sulfurtransferase complex subunit TusD [unclassified Shewanella]|uniref:sulfurtransferase complex subunit TusD n=1 Tax=unclassified Shewanella TaxID=196818 RepID=UPI000C81A9DD|nr:MULTISPECIES: sulfurtransferase complex subunit TusD [unclassified Shewanella]MDO6640845.1 sulfurtransferase complex subunit TusD [Shewanella sp. 5_MG-2023]MDO6678895.1 sulfurtransferase complex subunit TusD [Shewanella sp. 4_MG-2023]MDO6776155.1 sulfurtransferase complex subunit TusD [Shewanella sp. 3_MG-2023]PMG28755.1 sulfurtransferase TusD [Shewanella sp. 10N.286.52.C2]PMG42439.1 sulfurtransferase TusD [Shewanella sp. 10N.286.52.B9]